MIYDIMNDGQRKAYEENLECDFSFAIPGLARFRVNAFVQNRGAAAVMRTIPSKILSLEDLKAPKIFAELADQPRGVVLVTGPTGSGKSTTLAAMVDHKNDSEYGHILTIEDPIEFVPSPKKCLINQREVGPHTLSVQQRRCARAGARSRFSSMVRMWPYSLSFLWSTMAARVVDLPEPVGPVTSTTPRGCRPARRNLRRLEILQRQYLGGNGPHHRRRAAVLHEGVDAEARQAGNGEGEVALQVFFVGLALAVVHDVVDHAVDVLVVHGRQVDAAHVAVHADHGRQTRGQVQVGGLVLDHEGEELGDIHI